KRIRLHIGTAELLGYVVLLGTERLEPGQSGFVQIRTEQPAFALPGDRFIIRQYSPMITIGGGQVLDASPAKHRGSDKSVVHDLRLLSEGYVADRLLWFVRSSDISGIELSVLVGRTGMTPAMIRAVLSDLTKAKKVRILSENPTVAISEEVFSQALKQTLSEV